MPLAPFLIFAAQVVATPPAPSRLSCESGGREAIVELALQGRQRISGTLRRTQARTGLHSARLLLTGGSRRTWTGIYADSGPPPAHAAGYFSPRFLLRTLVGEDAVARATSSSGGAIDVGALVMGNSFNFVMEVRAGNRLWARFDWVYGGRERWVEGDLDLGTLQPSQLVFACRVDDFVIDDFALR